MSLEVLDQVFKEEEGVGWEMRSKCSFLIAMLPNEQMHYRIKVFPDHRGSLP
jgi:hypothetical protein